MTFNVALKCLTYTSLARLDFKEDDLLDILAIARDLNALDGITGLLIFNGTHFLQVLEGAPDAIDDLVERLRSDSRHSALEIRDDRSVPARSFPDWSMELVKVKSQYFQARKTVADRLPSGVAENVRQDILAMTELISGDVDMKA